MGNYYEIIDFLDHYAGKKYTATDFDIYNIGSRTYDSAKQLANAICKTFAHFKCCGVSKWQNSGYLAKYFWIQFKRPEYASSPYSISILNVKVNGKYRFKVYLEVDNNKANIFTSPKGKIIDFNEAVLKCYQPDADIYYEGMTIEKAYYKINSDYDSISKAVYDSKFLKITTNIDVETSKDDSDESIVGKLSNAFTKLIPYYDAIFERLSHSWVIPCDVDKYDVISAFNEFEEVEWHYTPQTQKICVGDKVYIYVGKPYSRIMHKCSVVKANVTFREIDDKKFIKDELAFANEKCFRIKLIRKIGDLRLSLTALNNNGINGNIQGARRLENGTVAYIEKILRTSNIQPNGKEEADIAAMFTEEEIEAVLNTEDDTACNAEDDTACNAEDDTACYVYKVGIQKLRKLNHKIIEDLKRRYKGQCQLCGQKIGEEFGKEIVEAHHIEPFSKTQNNDSTNIVVLCPNCHALMHKCEPVYDVQNQTFDFGNGIIRKLKIVGHLE